MDTKNIIIAILVIAVLGLGYYSFYQNQTGGDSEIATKEKCRKVGSEIHQSIVDEYNNSDPEASLMRAEYIYNARLNTCLYASGSISSTDDGKPIVQRWVRNSLTNEEILSHSSIDGERFNGLTVDEFEKQKELLFNE